VPVGLGAGFSPEAANDNVAGWSTLPPIGDRLSALSPHLNERERRLLAATDSAAAGYGGIAAVSAATGIAVSTIGRGLKDLAEASGLMPGRVRRTGGGVSRWSTATLVLLTT
jgi:hypothetical protein